MKLLSQDLVKAMTFLCLSVAIDLLSHLIFRVEIVEGKLYYSRSRLN